jgi:monofunctional biosynthetic peptidoglycan transglycosylase
MDISGQQENWFLRRFVRALFFLAVIPLSIYFGTVIVLASLYKIIDPPLSTLIILRRLDGTQIHPQHYLALRRIPLFARRGIIHLEDPTFWQNSGIDLGAIRDAYELDRRVGHLVYGGSTITQQLARTLFLVPNKNYTRKALEIGTALLMTTILGKSRILELYLNSIEWGPGIFGINAGSLYWYRTDVRDLDADHIARLEAIIVNPRYFKPYRLPARGGVWERYHELMQPLEPPPVPAVPGTPPSPVPAPTPSPATPTPATPPNVPSPGTQAPLPAKAPPPPEKAPLPSRSPSVK